MLAFTNTYIANTLGWMTGELGRQPWLIYGMFQTRDGYSKVVSNGDAIFTLIGFTGLYFVIGLLFLGLTGREIGKGPDEESTAVFDQREAVTTISRPVIPSSVSVSSSTTLLTSEILSPESFTVLCHRCRMKGT